jgi:hypothetical protein
MSAAIRSLHLTYPGQYKVDVECTAKDHLYKNNPDIIPVDRTKQARYARLEYPLFAEQNTRPIHFMEAFCHELGRIIGKPLYCKVNRPTLVLGDDEKTPTIEGGYAIINAGGKRDMPVKWIGRKIGQELVDGLPNVNFVQIGQSNEVHPKLNGVVDMIDKTTIRELIRLVAHAKFCIGPSTLLQHIAAALQVPYVAVLAARESRSWTTYPTQIDLTMAGCLPCCKDSACLKTHLEGPSGKVCLLPVFNGEELRPKCIEGLGSKAVIEAVHRLGEANVIV